MRKLLKDLWDDAEVFQEVPVLCSFKFVGIVYYVYIFQNMVDPVELSEFVRENEKTLNVDSLKNEQENAVKCQSMIPHLRILRPSVGEPPNFHFRCHMAETLLCKIGCVSQSCLEDMLCKN